MPPHPHSPPRSLEKSPTEDTRKPRLNRPNREAEKPRGEKEARRTASRVFTEALSHAQELPPLPAVLPSRRSGRRRRDSQRRVTGHRSGAARRESKREVLRQSADLEIAQWSIPRRGVIGRKKSTVSSASSSGRVRVCGRAGRATNAFVSD